MSVSQARALSVEDWAQIGSVQVASTDATNASGQSGRQAEYYCL